MCVRPRVSVRFSISKLEAAPGGSSNPMINAFSCLYMLHYSVCVCVCLARARQMALHVLWFMTPSAAC